MVEMTSTIACPACGHCHEEVMAEDAVQAFYKCKGCGLVMTPKRGKCCVFCSYGSVKCPDAQRYERPRRSKIASLGTASSIG